MTHFKTTTIYTLVILVGILIAAFIVPAGIKLFFKGLLWFMNNPATGLVITSAFLVGCFIGNFETKSK